jgi:SAM-dependent methyltransferase
MNLEINELPWEAYFQRVVSQPHRKLVEYAASLNLELPLEAIDCGCGTGSDISYLVECGYRVYAFDAHEKAVKICTERFAGNPKIKISQNSFENYTYPVSSLVIANSSLFFCDQTKFDSAWNRISGSLSIGGIFCGDFLGDRDSWASDPTRIQTVLTRDKVAMLFSGFRIFKWDERDELGLTALGRSKNWHTITVVARKLR